MSRANGVLVVSLTYKWWDMIASGEKLEEYRGENWIDRLLTGIVPKDHPNATFAPYHTLRAQRGYTGVWLERKIKRIRWGPPRPEWAGDTVTGDCFIIELETQA
jgi:hypothetical protein